MSVCGAEQLGSLGAAVMMPLEQSTRLHTHMQVCVCVPDCSCAIVCGWFSVLFEGLHRPIAAEVVRLVYGAHMSRCIFTTHELCGAGRATWFMLQSCLSLAQALHRLDFAEGPWLRHLEWHSMALLLQAARWCLALHAAAHSAQLACRAMPLVICVLMCLTCPSGH